MAGFGITTAQFTVLLLVRDNPGLNQKTLAHALEVETPRMVLIVDRLEDRGLVTRLAPSTDGPCDRPDARGTPGAARPVSGCWDPG